jgi:O-antigen ligase
MLPMSKDWDIRLIHVSLALYIIATWCSIAGMEVFGWLTFLLTTVYLMKKRIETSHELTIDFKTISPFLPWKTLIALFAIAALGLMINGTAAAEPVYSLGSLRWMILVSFLSLAFAIAPPSLSGYRVFLILTSLIAIYAIFQSFTGIDFMRPGENRAVQTMEFGEGKMLWRSAGFFGSPLQYCYIAGQYVCLPLVMGLLSWQNGRTKSWLFWGSAIAYTLISLSIVTTYARGAWVAMATAHLILAMIVSKRLGLTIAGAGVALTSLLFSTVEVFRLRLLTFFDPSYSSNSERWFLWKVNWHMFLDYPILGVGYLENERRASEYVARLGKPEHFIGHAHNNYLQMLSGTGILGFTAYMTLISFMLWITWRLWKSLPAKFIWPRALALASLGAQIQLHIGGLTECNFKAGATNHNLMVAWALVIALCALQSKGLIQRMFKNL